MRITNLHFTKEETQHILQLARKALKRQRFTPQHAQQLINQLSPPNLLRLALSLPLKHRGGSRSRAGRPRTTPSN